MYTRTQALENNARGSRRYRSHKHIGHIYHSEENRLKKTQIPRHADRELRGEARGFPPLNILRCGHKNYENSAAARGPRSLPGGQYSYLVCTIRYRSKISKSRAALNYCSKRSLGHTVTPMTGKQIHIIFNNYTKYKRDHAPPTRPPTATP